ncbi:hypothetical protein [Methylophaga sp. UBA2689]|uniref:hypothetical protein n=1 Tax=Methylophaga sp. UBA2689 TaxID=1946878 RepID=UPI0025E763E3|nr:hypothetical protein [Methylophaga sp. UBA2689]
MNLLISIVFLLGFHGLVHAEASQEEKDALCNNINVFAGSAMAARQNGVTLAQAISTIKNQEDEDVKELLRTITMDAYESPAYQSDEHKNREIVEFQNEWYMICLKEIS